MEFLITLAILITLIGLLAFIGPKVAEVTKPHLSSGKVLPDDDELRLLCVDQLITDYNAEELNELADIAISHLKDEAQNIRCQWEDFLRRVYQASDEKSGIVC